MRTNNSRGQFEIHKNQVPFNKPVMDVAIVFKPTPSTQGVLFVSKRFDRKDVLEGQKQTDSDGNATCVGTPTPLFGDSISTGMFGGKAATQE